MPGPLAGSLPSHGGIGGHLREDHLWQPIPGWASAPIAEMQRPTAKPEKQDSLGAAVATEGLSELMRNRLGPWIAAFAVSFDWHYSLLITSQPSTALER